MMDRLRDMVRTFQIDPRWLETQLRRQSLNFLPMQRRAEKRHLQARPFFCLLRDLIEYFHDGFEAFLVPTNLVRLVEHEEANVVQFELVRLDHVGDATWRSRDDVDAPGAQFLLLFGHVFPPPTADQ